MTLKTLKLVLIFLLGAITGLKAQKVICKADFGSEDLNSNWRQEFEYPDSSSAFVQDDALVIASYGGATLWLNKPISGEFIIEYDRMVCVDSGAYDRLSDLNQFWLAQEHDETDSLHIRDGALASYNDLTLFYVGVGGNHNTTTRFRRYDGKGDRVLLAEKNQPEHLLQANVYYRVRTVVSPAKGYTRFFVNGKLLFEYIGNIPQRGYFGFRLTASRQQIKNFRVYREE